MKIIVYSIAIWIITYTNIYSQNQHTVQVESNQIVNCSADESWEMVNDWENLHNLVPAVVKSTVLSGKGLNSTWQINLVNGKVIMEKMTYYDTTQRTMSYIMTETPMPITNYSAIIKVEPYGISKSMISFYTECQTTDNNVETMTMAFKTFQETYLSNIEKQSL